MAVDTYRKAAMPLQSYLESDLFNQVVTNPTFKFFPGQGFGVLEGTTKFCFVSFFNALSKRPE